jgi:molybdopterin/thiamine biosynthesis adenylyltransferase
MTAYSLTMQEEHFDTLKSLLLRDDGCEHSAYLLCRKARAELDPWERQSRENFLVTEIIEVPEGDVVESTPISICWRTASYVRALKRAADSEQVVAVVHSHPAGHLRFSGQDDVNECDLLQAAQNRNGPDTRILSLVLTQDGKMFGRVWIHPSETGHVPMSKIRTVGSRITMHYPGRGRTGFKSAEAFKRQALAFGAALNDDLRQLRVGVVGCGGTGSALAMLLARLGVGGLLLIDNDIVESTNLNRLHGACQSDADAMLPKAEVVAREVARMGLGVQAVPINAWVGDEKCREGLRSCDIVFGCTDDDDGRLFLNRFAYYYLTPVIDVGLGIEVGDEGATRVRALNGRVTVIGPGHTCLLCQEIIDPALAAEQALKRKNPNEYEKRKAEAYVQGEGNPSPAVVTFTTEVACMGVNELIHRLQGFRGENGHAPNRVRLFHFSEDRRQSRPPRNYCPVCGTRETWGAGDTDPFLGRVG